MVMAAHVELGRSEGPDPYLGLAGVFKVLDVRVDHIVPHRVRHVIKRYLKCVGLTHLKVRHAQDFTTFGLRLLVEGRADRPLKQEQLDKLGYLNECVTQVLRNGGTGPRLPPSVEDGELLRGMLAQAEPHLRRVYYSRA